MVLNPMVYQEAETGRVQQRISSPIKGRITAPILMGIS